MKLIIAEKPDLANDIAKALLKNPINENGIIKDNEYIVVSAFGHLLSLCEPDEYDSKYKKWNLDTLPIAFENWKRKPAEETYKRKRLDLIGELLSLSTCVIHAGDPDDEGQLLIDEILDYFNYKGTVYRVYINDSVEKHIQKEFEFLKLNDKKMRNEGESAYARQMADKAFGINETRLASIKLQASNLSIGRVQTPTLGLVVNRDMAIANHTKEKYYILKAFINLKNNETQYNNVEFIYKPSLLLLGDNKHIMDKSVLENIIPYINNNKSCSVIESEEHNYAPLPYNQTELSADMNAKYGYSLKKTLEITQTLRDKYKAISYNRSDCQYLSEEHYKEAPNLLNSIFKILDYEYPVDLTMKSKCFNDKNITAHHGIIPVDKKIELSNMTIDEKNIYLAISERYIMQFLDPEKNIVSTATIVLSDEKGILQHINKITIDEGYKKFFTNNGTSNVHREGDYTSNSTFIARGDYDITQKINKIEEKETKPLKFYTPGSLVKDMCSISKYVSDPKIKDILKQKDKDKKGENGSIGTVATRGAIVDTLQKRGFLEMKGKNIITTTLGREFYNLLPKEIKTPDITAQWWLILEDIKNGKSDHNALLLKVIDNFKQYASTAYINKTLSIEKEQKEIIGKCPKCRSNVFEGKMKNGKTMFYCENKECNFALFHSMKYFDNELIITKAKAKQLLDGQAKFKIKKINGSIYEAKFKLELSENKYVNITKIKI
ncbi:MAG: DNA topoisomerase [Bacilli bacterium]